MEGLWCLTCFIHQMGTYHLGQEWACHLQEGDLSALTRCASNENMFASESCRLYCIGLNLTVTKWAEKIVMEVFPMEMKYLFINHVTRFKQ